MGWKLERGQGYLRNESSSKTSSELKAAEEAGGPRSRVGQRVIRRVVEAFLLLLL